MTRNRCNECGGQFTGDHPQVGITDEYGVHAHVDVGIAHLVQACWALGIVTTGSCQGGDGEPTTLGFGPGSAERFATAATSSRTGMELEAEPDDVLDWRIYEARHANDPTGWRWLPGYPWAPGFVVSFPPEDIPELTSRLQLRVEEIGP